ncbi:MAG TPA: Gfo/Idh/MocA family oxidoreductase [Chloroflexota bacterium]|nr:Gfo/Idh/MocA family oxidoreductase [Chloroflexota bacterium]
MVDQPLRSIHVGVGTRGKSHLRAALECGYWRPVALVDVVPDYLAAAREMTGLPESACFGRVEDAVAAVEADAVIIASPVMLHAAQIMAALEGVRHVLTEKCFTVGLADAVRCVAEAERRERKLMVVQNARLHAPARTLRRLVAEQRYGPLGLFLMSFFKVRRRPYNLSPHMHLWQQGVHELDTMLAVVQQPLRRVWGVSNNPAWCDWPSPSTVQAVCEFDGGVSGTFVSTSNARAAGYEFRLECAEAAVISTGREDGSLTVRFGPHRQGEETIPLDPPDVRGLEHHPLARAALAGETGRGAGALRDLIIYRDFYAYIVEGKEPESSGRRNLDTMRCVEAVQRSTELGRPVDVAELLESAPALAGGERRP